MTEIRKIMGRYGKPILLVTYLPGTAVQMTRRFQTTHLRESGTGGRSHERPDGVRRLPERCKTRTPGRSGEIPLKASLPDELRNASRPDESQGKRILAHYGIAVPRHGTARSEAEAAALAGRIGYPTVLKILSAEIEHKTDAGGVLLHLENEEEVRAAVQKIRRRFPVSFQDRRAVAAGGRDGLRRGGGPFGYDARPPFRTLAGHRSGRYPGGSLERRGLCPSADITLSGGKDVAFAQGFFHLNGVRGRPPADFQALIRATVDFSLLVAEMGVDFDSIEINPLLVLPEGHGVRAVDAAVYPKGAESIALSAERKGSGQDSLECLER